MDDIHPEARSLVERLALSPHPEGGYFRETWRSPARVATPRGERSAMTLIHYLLPSGSFSAFHRVHADEVWQHAGGDPLELHVIDPGGAHEVHRLGKGGLPHAVVPAGWWQAARVRGERYALLGCTVAPGFDFADFEMARAEELLRIRPDLRAVVGSLCRAPSVP
jgi:predicted cupin superfamily sugar epimerase